MLNGQSSNSHQNSSSCVVLLAASWDQALSWSRITPLESTRFHSISQIYCHSSWRKVYSLDAPFKTAVGNYSQTVENDNEEDITDDSESATNHEEVFTITTLINGMVKQVEKHCHTQHCLLNQDLEAKKSLKISSTNYLITFLNKLFYYTLTDFSK